jgi:tripeptide aminopeptidase
MLGNVAHDIPAVTLGVGRRQVHGPDEWIDLTDFERACRLIPEIATAG